MVVELDSARGLKAELLGRLTTRTGHLVTARSEALRGQAAPAGVAVGIVPSPAVGGFKVGLRATSPDWEADKVLAHLIRRAGSEADARVVGLVRTQSAPTPAELQRRCRPVQVGCSIGHSAVTAGTLGCFVTHPDHDGVSILSNSHVLADSGRALVGDPVLQPGVADGGNVQADIVGRLLAFAPMSDVAANVADVAVAALTDVDGGTVTNALPDGVRLVGTTEEQPDDDRVFKLGRTTGHTQGTVTLVEVDGVAVEYELGTYTFDGTIEIEGTVGAFSEGGDSGSVVYTADGLGLGLLFAGSETGRANGEGLTYASPLRDALALVGAALL